LGTESFEGKDESIDLPADAQIEVALDIALKATQSEAQQPAGERYRHGCESPARAASIRRSAVWAVSPLIGWSQKAGAHGVEVH
jgi:hypothetical protein